MTVERRHKAAWKAFRKLYCFQRASISKFLSGLNHLNVENFCPFGFAHNWNLDRRNRKKKRGAVANFKQNVGRTCSLKSIKRLREN